MLQSAKCIIYCNLINCTEPSMLYKVQSALVKGARGRFQGMAAAQQQNEHALKCASRDRFLFLCLSLPLSLFPSLPLALPPSLPLSLPLLCCGGLFAAHLRVKLCKTPAFSSCFAESRGRATTSYTSYPLDGARKSAPELQQFLQPTAW